MKSSPEILHELMTISPFLAGLDKVNVFKVPQGYFDELDLRIANYAILNNVTPADNINTINIQQVPEGYFDSLSDSILAKVKIAYPAEPEMNSPLDNLKGVHVFSVPEGYFENLAGSILNKVQDEEAVTEPEGGYVLSATLQSVKGINVFDVPEGYFDSLSDSILGKITAQEAENAEVELRKMSPLLYSIKGENIFTVPAGYFDSLAGTVLDKVAPQPRKVVTMKRRSSWLQYAAAAIVIGIISITSFLLFNGSHKADSSEVALLPDYVKASMKYKTSEDLNAAIAKLSDAEITQYLEKNGNVMDNELLINNTDVTELPSTSDYLSNENALNEYLQKIDAGNVSKLTP